MEKVNFWSRKSSPESRDVKLHRLWLSSQHASSPPKSMPRQSNSAEIQGTFQTHISNKIKYFGEFRLFLVFITLITANSTSIKRKTNKVEIQKNIYCNNESFKSAILTQNFNIFWLFLLKLKRLRPQVVYGGTDTRHQKSVSLWFSLLRLIFS